MMLRSRFRNCNFVHGRNLALLKMPMRRSGALGRGFVEGLGLIGLGGGYSVLSLGIILNSD